LANGSKELAAAEEALVSRDLPRGERLLKRLLAAAPHNSRANELMAYVLGQQGDAAGAVRFLEKATAAAGASAAAWYHLGFARRRAGKRSEARTAFERSIAVDPDFFPAHHDLGYLLYEMGLAEESLAALDRAASLAPASFEAHHNRGRTLHALRRYEEALASYGRAVALRPDHAPTYLNRGEAYNDLRRYDEALADFARALELRPGYDDVRWNESLTRLILGQFEVGLPLYECRYKGEMTWSPRHQEIPPWLGDADIARKRLLVWWEQGFGDTLNFCRYVPMLRERGADVVFEVQAPLKRLMSSLGTDIEVIASGDALPPCDFQVPLLSLPLAFRTTLDTIPARVPYLSADAEKVRLWRERIPKGERLNVGVACSGHKRQKDDEARSMALRELAPLAEIANLFLVQVDVRPDDRAFASESGGRVRVLEDEIRDFDDSAAIVANLDLVVTIDTALAHLAGALAKPVWIMLPWTPTWRWMAEREDSPWYPTARLFRQSARGRWDDVIARVRDELRALAPGH
jgi:tetratricopeptide (TPR) repeat protein